MANARRGRTKEVSYAAPRMADPKEHARDGSATRRPPAGRGSNAKWRFELNGRAAEVTAPPLDRLSRVLAQKLSIKLPTSCEGHACGGCQVLLDGELVQSCAVPMVHVDGASVVTSEGLKTDRVLKPVREGLRRLASRPCERCLPGLLVTTRAFLEGESVLPGESAREALEGNRCTCDGSAFFVEMVETLARPVRSRRPARAKSAKPAAKKARAARPKAARTAGTKARPAKARAQAARVSSRRSAKARPPEAPAAKKRSSGSRAKRPARRHAPRRRR